MGIRSLFKGLFCIHCQILSMVYERASGCTIDFSISFKLLLLPYNVSYKIPGLCIIKLENKGNQIKNRSLFFGLDVGKWMLPWLHSSVLINATQASLPSSETKSIFHPEDMAYRLRGPLSARGAEASWPFTASVYSHVQELLRKWTGRTKRWAGWWTTILPSPSACTDSQHM